MTPEAIVITHSESDQPGAITRELSARGVKLREVRSYAGDAVPEGLGTASALVVMGGPMGADDDEAYPFLTAEKRLLASATTAGAHVLGVCLGSQMLACAVGGGVVRGGTRPQEIGWYDVERTRADALFEHLPRTFTPFHWHGDAIVAPASALVLARSRATKVQAFRAGERAYGVQFHLESSAEMIEGMLREFAGELASEGKEPAALAQATKAHIGEQERLAALFFGAWADRVAGR
jgi:GMP synthase-like glutamine amidotransferase